jgi:hypothetical protein
MKRYDPDWKIYMRLSFEFLWIMVDIDLWHTMPDCWAGKDDNSYTLFKHNAG